MDYQDWKLREYRKWKFKRIDKVVCCFTVRYKRKPRKTQKSKTRPRRLKVKKRVGITERLNKIRV